MAKRFGISNGFVKKLTDEHERKHQRLTKEKEEADIDDADDVDIDINDNNNSNDDDDDVEQDNNNNNSNDAEYNEHVYLPQALPNRRILRCYYPAGKVDGKYCWERLYIKKKGDVALNKKWSEKFKQITTYLTDSFPEWAKPKLPSSPKKKKKKKN